jgi:deoxycytidine triphosphate deaminase
MNRFAQTDDEARDRSVEFKSKDPFPDIESALLNSADIEDYVAATGMIYAFDPQKMISASYEVCLDGKVFRWNSKGEEDFISIEDAGGFTLERNSIAFVHLKTKFRIPDYIALRFNLIIKHVHRGILLGTGPLVDPGFEGNLLIPLHNLTANEYRFSAGEALIWVEFTKISNNQLWANETAKERSGQYRSFPDDKKNRDPKYYFENAAGGRPIRSSIPDAIQTSADMAEKARNSAKEAADKAESIREEAKRQIGRVQWIAIAGSILAIGTILVSIYLGNRLVLQLVSIPTDSGQ